MTPYKAVITCIWNKYATFAGRSSRGEFFSYFLFFAIFCALWGVFLAAIIDFSHDLNLLDWILLYVPIAMFPPLLSVSARRLHDCSKSAWLLILLFIPVINLFGFYLLCLPGCKGPNRFGQPPMKVLF